jgi:hypothetical protein
MAISREYYIFGSFINSPAYHDIDVLIVVASIIDIENLTKEILKLNTRYPKNIVHVQVYTLQEYLDEENKFSIKKVNHKISKDQFYDLYKIRPTKVST